MPAARAQGDDGLRGLEAGVERVLEWVGEGREPGRPVWRGDGQEHEPGDQHRRQQDQMALAAAAGKVDRGEDRGRDHGSPQVPLLHQDSEDQRQLQGIGQEAVVEIPDPVLPLFDPMRAVDDEAELAQLGGLEGAQGPEVEPAPGAVDLDAEVRDQDCDHQHQRRGRGHRRQAAQPVVVDPHQDEHGRQPHADAGQLAGEEVERPAVLEVGQRLAGAEDEHQTQSRQCQGYSDQWQVAIALRLGRASRRGRADAGERAHAVTPWRARTAPLKRRPRSS